MPALITAQDFDAVLFDLDGVLTTTRALHAAAWKRTFDEFLAAWDTTHGTVSAPFEQRDYAAQVDGKPRQDGVRDFLATRGIDLPEGRPESATSEKSVWGLGNRKERLVADELARSGVEAFPGSIAWVRELREAGLRTAVVTSSQLCSAILERAGIGNLFDGTVDGEALLRLRLRGKPAADSFLEAARLLHVSPDRAAVVDDAVAGVRAGRAGGFRMVIGVDRDANAPQLLDAGADLIVTDLAELLAGSDEPVHRTGPRGHRLRTAARRIMASTGDYPAHPWRLVERAYNPAFVAQTETLFALSNGYVGIRGAPEEGEPAFRPGTVLNGFHETWPIVYPEQAHGFAATGQTIVPVPDGTTIRVLVDEDPVTCETAEALEFERALDMSSGTVERYVVYQLTDGRRLSVRTRRFVSLVQRHLAGIRYEVTALDRPITLTVSSELVGTHHPVDAQQTVDPRQTRSLEADTLQPDIERAADLLVIRTYRTRRSRLVVAAAMDHVVDDAALSHVGTTVDHDRARVVFEVDAQPGRTAGFTKWLAYHYADAEPADLADRAALTLARARRVGYERVLADHAKAVADFWARSDVIWEGGPAAQQALHFTLFSLLQASYRSAGHGVPAKGLTGTGYEGHYFWDTEAYVLPFLSHTTPEVARSLLMHRVRMLPSARRRAREVGCSGALFPWRTINGEEASANYEAGTAQYHIDADIAYALDQYVTVTGDTDFLFRHGVELLVETARMWADLGFFSDRHDGQFVINKVTGPDEYSTVVDNNLYTNLMAARNLTTAADAVDRVRTESPQDYRRMADSTGLREDEVSRWRRIADRIFVPYDQRAELHLQDDHFLDQAPWDFAGTPVEQYPLLLHFHPLVIYRHQVIKQTDVVLATVLLPDRFTAEQRRRIFDYYDPLTTGDSSLSECIQAIAAADVGKLRTAEEYLIDAAAIDMADTAGNLRDGVHVASAGGAWMAVVYGFGRYRWRTTEFAPILPTRARRLRFSLRLRGSLLEVDVEEHQVSYSLSGGPPLTARHYGTEFTVAADAPRSFPGSYRTDDGRPVP